MGGADVTQPKFEATAGALLPPKYVRASKKKLVDKGK